MIQSLMETVASPFVVVLAIVILVLEILVLIRFEVFRVRWSVGDVLCMQLPGLFLLAALLEGLTSSYWPRILLFLSAALVAHLVDVRRRARSQTARAGRFQ